MTYCMRDTQAFETCSVTNRHFTDVAVYPMISKDELPSHLFGRESPSDEARAAASSQATADFTNRPWHESAFAGGAPSSQSPEHWFANEVYIHEPVLRSYLHGTFPAVRDVDDVVQESYLRIWKASTASPIRSAKAFLFQVARHLALDLLRRKTASPIQGVTDVAAAYVLDEKPNAAEVAFSRDELGLLAQAIHALPARCREIVVLRKIKGLAQKEIAKQLGISEQTVQVQVLRGVNRVEAFLRKHGVQSSSAR